MNEIYKDIQGYEGKYQVSNLGNVKSLHYNNTNKEKVLKTVLHKDGYLFVSLGYGKTRAIHRLVAETFLPNPDNMPVVNHKDENKQNNSVDNLEWCSYEYNSNYGTNAERIAKNESKPINQYDLQGNFIKSWNSGTEIKRTLGYSNGNICNCCRGKQKTAYGYKWQYAELLGG